MNSVNNAYDFAASTVQLYGNTPQDQNVLDLGEILFGEAAVSTAINNLAGLSSTSAYKGIGNANVAGADEVVIACGMAYMVDETETDEDGTVTTYHFDEEGEYCESGDEVTYQACKTGVPAGYALAYTLNTPPGTPARKYILSKFDRELDLSGLALRAQQLMDNAAFTPFDLYGELERTILHELGHTRSGGGLDDLPSRDPSTFGNSGWKYATSVLSPIENAESHAILGIGGKIIQLGFSVDPTGDLHQIATSKKERGYREPESGVPGHALFRKTARTKARM
ncbi:MAG: hypothetical protein Q9161_001141 [Pseudevernia consocians]